MLKSSSPAQSRGQWSLIGTLVAVALLILLAGLYLPHLLKPEVGETGAEQSALQRANGVACTEYVPQLNAAVEQYKQDNGHPPSSLNDLKKYGVTDDMINSPGCAFQMDPATGRVTNGPPRSPAAAPRPRPTASPPPPAAALRPSPTASRQPPAPPRRRAAAHAPPAASPFHPSPAAGISARARFFSVVTLFLVAAGQRSRARQSALCRPGSAATTIQPFTEPQYGSKASYEESPVSLVPVAERPSVSA